MMRLQVGEESGLGEKAGEGGKNLSQDQYNIGGKFVQFNRCFVCIGRVGGRSVHSLSRILNLVLEF